MNPKVWVAVLVVWTVAIVALLAFGVFGPPVEGIG